MRAVHSGAAGLREGRLGRLGTVAIDGAKIAANASWHATCRREWLQQQVDEIVAQAAAQDAAPEGETPWQLRGRRDREERLRRALAEVIAEEAERGLDAESVAARERKLIEATRSGRNDLGSCPARADAAAIAEARLQAAQDRLAGQKAAKREQIAATRERIQQFEAGEGPKPNPGPFSFDENRGQDVARARRWVARAERELAATRQHAACAPAQQPGGDAVTSAVPGGGRRSPRGKNAREDRPAARLNVTDPDSRPMHGADGGQLQGYNAQLAVTRDGLILSPEVVQDCNAGGNWSR